MATEENKRTMRRFIEEVWDKGNVDVIDEILADDYVDHNPGPGGSSREAMKQSVRMMRESFPDLQTVELDLIAENDRVVARYWAIGTQRGEFMGAPASDRAVCMGGISIARFVDGKIVENWNSFDMLGLMQQVGLMEPVQGSGENR